MAAAAVGEDDGGDCWLLAVAIWPSCFLGVKGIREGGEGGVVKKPVAPEGRGQEGLLAKCTVTVDA
jgi:hypothetical protein